MCCTWLPTPYSRVSAKVRFLAADRVRLLSPGAAAEVMHEASGNHRAVAGARGFAGLHAYRRSDGNNGSVPTEGFHDAARPLRRHAGDRGTLQWLLPGTVEVRRQAL